VTGYRGKSRLLYWNFKSLLSVVLMTPFRKLAITFDLSGG